jgi:hypothetical protein
MIALRGASCFMGRSLHMSCSYFADGPFSHSRRRLHQATTNMTPLHGATSSRTSTDQPAAVHPQIDNATVDECTELIHEPSSCSHRCCVPTRPIRFRTAIVLSSRLLRMHIPSRTILHYTLPARGYPLAITRHTVRATLRYCRMGSPPLGIGTSSLSTRDAPIQIQILGVNSTICRPSTTERTP